MKGSTKHRSWVTDVSYNRSFKRGVDPRTSGMRDSEIFTKLAVERSEFVFQKLQKVVNGEWRRIVKNSTIGRWPPAADADILPHIGQDGVRRVGDLYVFTVGWYPFKHRSGDKGTAILQSEARIGPRLLTLYEIIRKEARKI